MKIVISVIWLCLFPLNAQTNHETPSIDQIALVNELALINPTAPINPASIKQTSIQTSTNRTTSIKVTDVRLSDASSARLGRVTLSCTTDYDPARCIAGAHALAKVLERYPTAKLGDWTFVLASSEHWEQTVKSLGGDTESPAFSELGAHVTVLEDVFFDNANPRRAALAQRYGQTPDRFLDYAVTHEMGHTICNERNEKQADAYGLGLRMGITPACRNAH